MLLLGRSVLGQIIHLVYTFYKEQKMLVYVPAWGYQLLLDSGTTDGDKSLLTSQKIFLILVL